MKFDLKEIKKLKKQLDEANHSAHFTLQQDLAAYMLNYAAYLIACAEECEAWREWDDVHLSDDPDADHSEANRASERLDDARVATDAARSEQ